jgi:hypothetical protein
MKFKTLLHLLVFIFNSLSLVFPIKLISCLLFSSVTVLCRGSGDENSFLYYNQNLTNNSFSDDSEKMFIFQDLLNAPLSINYSKRKFIWMMFMTMQSRERVKRRLIRLNGLRVQSVTQVLTLTTHSIFSLYISV